MLRSVPTQWLSVATEQCSFGGQTSSREAQTPRGDRFRDARQGPKKIGDIVACDDARFGTSTSDGICFSISTAGQGMLLVSLSQMGLTMQPWSFGALV